MAWSLKLEVTYGTHHIVPETGEVDTYVLIFIVHVVDTSLDSEIEVQYHKYNIKDEVILHTSTMKLYYFVILPYEKSDLFWTRSIHKVHYVNRNGSSFWQDQDQKLCSNTVVSSDNCGSSINNLCRCCEFDYCDCMSFVCRRVSVQSGVISNVCLPGKSI